MDGSIQVYYGDGRGKTTASLGLGIRAAGMGKSVIMVQFLKRKHSETLNFLKKLEPELQIFRFAKAACAYSDLDEEERREQLSNIKTALSYTKKVLETGQCDLLILDEILGLIDFCLISVGELKELLALRNESMDLILTGREFPDELKDIADCIYCIHKEKEQRADILTTGKSI